MSYGTNLDADGGAGEKRLGIQETVGATVWPSLPSRWVIPAFSTWSPEPPLPLLLQALRETHDRTGKDA